MPSSQETMNALAKEVVALIGQVKGLRKDIEELSALVKGDSPDKSLIVRAVRNEDRLDRIETDLEEHVVLCLADKKVSANRFWGFVLQNSPVILTWAGVAVYMLVKGL